MKQNAYLVVDTETIKLIDEEWGEKKCEKQPYKHQGVEEGGGGAAAGTGAEIPM